MADQGHYRCYAPKNFREEDLRLLGQANAIIAEYEAQGLVLTVRQLYYQHVARGLIENRVENYSRLARLLSDGRLAGLVSWTAIEDRGRNLKGINHHETPEQALRNLAEKYSRDKWFDQPMRPEVWVEKEALEGVIGSICNELEVDFFACKGYNSQSEQWRAGRRLAGRVAAGQVPIIFHLGDHDPSGIDMTRDNRDRLSMFAGVPIQVVRLALNRPQIDALNPPPNPAKMGDPRFGDYRAEHGDESWELDALEPTYIRSLIRDAVVRVRDDAKWQVALEEEQAEREVLVELAEQLGEQADGE